MNKITSLSETFELVIELDPETKDPVGHPYAIWNFKQLYPEIDLQNLPENWAFFRRNPIPQELLVLNSQSVLKIPESTYVWSEGVVEDSWGIRDMNEEEKIAYYTNLRANYHHNVRLLNNNIILLKSWANHNIKAMENSEEWQAWLDSIPETINLPPELLDRSA